MSERCISLRHLSALGVAANHYLLHVWEGCVVFEVVDDSVEGVEAGDLGAARRID